MTQIMTDSIEVLGIGMAGVFTVLVLFYLIVKGLQKVFPYKGQ